MHSMYVNASNSTPSYTHVSLLYEESTPQGSKATTKIVCGVESANKNQKEVCDNKIKWNAQFTLIVPCLIINTLERAYVIIQIERESLFRLPITIAPQLRFSNFELTICVICNY